MRTESFLYEIERSAASLIGWDRATERCGELALERAQSALELVNRACAQVMAGQERDFTAGTKAAHCAAFELITFGEISRELELSEPDVCERLIASGNAVQARALEREKQYLNGSLSPSQMFFDDLVDLSLLESPQIPGDRPETVLLLREVLTARFERCRHEHVPRIPLHAPRHG